MNDLSSESTDTDPMAHALARLELRVEVLETKVAALPDPQQVEERITERLKANLPPPIDPSAPPGLKDIELPIPNLNTVVAGAKTTWMLFEMLVELRMLFWTLLDRRYHIAWVTRLATILLLFLILTSQWWVPLAKVDYLGPVLDKVADLLLGLILFLILHFEMRRYNEWRSKR